MTDDATKLHVAIQAAIIFTGRQTEQTARTLIAALERLYGPQDDKAIATRLRQAYRAMYACELDLDDDELVAEFEMHDCSFHETLNALSQ